MDDLVEMQFPGRDRRETLVDKDVHRIGVIDREQPQLIEVRGFPQLFSNLEDVAAVAGLQRIARDADVLLRRAGWSISSISTHDAKRHSERALPHDVGDEAEMLSIPCIEEGARAFELLKLEHVLIAAWEVDRLRHAVGPLHAQDVRL